MAAPAFEFEPRDQQARDGILNGYAYTFPEAAVFSALKKPTTAPLLKANPFMQSLTQGRIQVNLHLTQQTLNTDTFERGLQFGKSHANGAESISPSEIQSNEHWNALGMLFSKAAPKAISDSPISLSRLKGLFRQPDPEVAANDKALLDAFGA